MIAFIALISLAGVVLAAVKPEYSDLLLLAGPCLLASLWLLWRGGGSADRSSGRSSDRLSKRLNRLRDGADRPVQRATREHVIIDGSNVMHWDAGKVSLTPVVQAIEVLAAQRMTVGVIFDANAGYKLEDRYRDDAHMARALGLPEDRVLVVPKGVPADHYILSAARGLRARVVTNDRYRDWQADFPEVGQAGFLIRGGMKNGALWLDKRDLASREAGLEAPRPRA